MFSQKPPVVAWFQRCLCMPHRFGFPSRRKVDSSNRTHIPAISGIAANGSSVVGKLAKTTRKMCLFVLMVGATFCPDRVVHAPHGTDAVRPILLSWTFHVDPWNNCDNVEQRVQRRIRRNHVDLVQLGGQGDESRGSKHSCQTSWRQNTSCPTTQTLELERADDLANSL